MNIHELLHKVTKTRELRATLTKAITQSEGKSDVRIGDQWFSDTELNKLIQTYLKERMELADAELVKLHKVLDGVDIYVKGATE